MKYALPLIAFLSLAACGPAEQSAPAADQPAQAGEETTASAESIIALGSEGLRVVQADTGVTDLAAFGAPQAEVVAAVSGVLGEPTVDGDMTECGAGPLHYVDYGSGLRLWFSQGAFAGWLSAEGPLSTMDGLSADSTRADVEALGVTEFTQDTLGVEFSHSDVYGMLEPDSDEIAMLYAGVSCFFR